MPSFSAGKASNSPLQLHITLDNFCFPLLSFSLYDAGGSEVHRLVAGPRDSVVDWVGHGFAVRRAFSFPAYDQGTHTRCLAHLQETGID
jgi:hypothetical protein